MFSSGFYWEFPMESHALVGTGVPISLGTPVRHRSSKARMYAPSSKSFRRCCTPVPPTRKVRRPNSASNRNVAPQFREQDESGTSVPLRAHFLAPQFLEQNKSGTPVPLRAQIWHLSSANKINSGTPVPLTAKVWQLSYKEKRNAAP